MSVDESNPFELHPEIPWDEQRKSIDWLGDFLKNIFNSTWYFAKIMDPRWGIIFAIPLLYAPSLLFPELGQAGQLVGVFLWMFASFIPNYFTFIGRIKYDVIGLFIRGFHGEAIDEEFHFHTIEETTLITGPKMKGKVYIPSQHKEINLNDEDLKKEIAEREKKIKQLEEEKAKLKPIEKPLERFITPISLIIGQLFIGLIFLSLALFLEWRMTLFDFRIDFLIPLSVCLFLYGIIWRTGKIDRFFLTKFIDPRLIPPKLKITISQVLTSKYDTPLFQLNNEVSYLSGLEEALNEGEEGTFNTNLLLVKLGQPLLIKEKDVVRCNTPYIIFHLPGNAIDLSSHFLFVHKCQIEFPDGAIGEKNAYMGFVQLVSTRKGVPVLAPQSAPFGSIRYKVTDSLEYAKALKASIESQELNKAILHNSELRLQLKKAEDRLREVKKGKWRVISHWKDNFTYFTQKGEGPNLWVYVIAGFGIGVILCYLFLVNALHFEQVKTPTNSEGIRQLLR